MTAARVTPRRLWAVVTLALAIGGTGQPRLAQAAPPSQGGIEKYVFYLTPSGAEGLDRICVGDFVVFNVKAERLLANKFTYVLPDGTEYTNPPVQVAGVTIDGMVLNPAYGTLTPTSGKTSMRSNPPGSAVFTFVAKSPGTTELRFTGQVGDALCLGSGCAAQRIGMSRAYLGFTLDVKVEACNYKVTAISRWNGFGLNYVATIDQAPMSADAPGHFKGTATVYWVFLQPGVPAGCPAQAGASASQADMTGTMDADGQTLTVDLAYRQLDFVWRWNHYFSDCTVTHSTETMSYQPDPLTFSVPATGGGDKLAQTLVDLFPSGLNISGSADVAVVPAEKDNGE